MVAHHPTEPKDPPPSDGPPPARWLADPDPMTAVPDTGNIRDSGALTAVRCAFEQRLHWAAEAAALNALAGQFAPWEVIQHHAQAGVVPVTAAAGACMGWKLLFVGLPRLGRWMADRGLFHFEVRFSIGHHQPDPSLATGTTVGTRAAQAARR